jgi:glycosyltransferase involved in cell wall biosynthesis
LSSRYAWEIVVVDNGSNDSTRHEIDRAARRLPNLVPAHEPVPGLSLARNRALQLARGTLVAFTDDDCYPASDYLDRCVEAFGNARLGFVGGRVLLHDPQDKPITIQLSSRPVRYPPGSFVPPGAIHGANFVFRRKALEQAGGFDTLFGAGAPLKAGEDLDALARVSGIGWDGAYDPRLVVSHHHGRRTESEYQTLMSQYDFARGAWFAKALLDYDHVHRRKFVWPVLRRTMGHAAHLRVGTIRRELLGAIAYRQLSRRSGTRSVPQQAS